MIDHEQTRQAEIQAVSTALLAADDAYDPDGNPPGLYEGMAIAAITTLAELRRERFSEAVREFEDANDLYWQSITSADDVEAARSALYAAAGIPEAE